MPLYTVPKIVKRPTTVAKEFVKSNRDTLELRNFLHSPHYTLYHTVFMGFGGTNEMTKTLLNNIKRAYKNLIDSKTIIMNGGTLMGHNIPLNEVARKRFTLAFGCTTEESTKQNIKYPDMNAFTFRFDGPKATWGFETFYFYYMLDQILTKHHPIDKVVYSFVNGGSITMKEFLFAFLTKPILEKRYKHAQFQLVLHHGTKRFVDDAIKALDTSERFYMRLGKYAFKIKKQHNFLICKKVLSIPKNAHVFHINSIFLQDYIIINHFLYTRLKYTVF